MKKIMSVLCFVIIFCCSVTAFSQTAQKENTTTTKKTSISELQKKAEAGDASAQYNLAERYYFGEDIGKNLSKAVELYKKSAEQGFASAQYGLGGLYILGKGVPKDLVLAYAWLTLCVAQEGGHADANTTRDVISKTMTRKEKNEAESLSSDWKVGELLKRSKK